VTQDPSERSQAETTGATAPSRDDSEQRIGFAEIARRLGPAGVLGLLWTILPALGGFLLLAKIGIVSDWLNAHPGLGVALYIVIFALSSGLGLLPTYAQAILGGWVFGFPVGFPAALAGFTGGSLVGYVVARTVSRERVERLIEEHRKARVVRKALIGQGFWRTLGIVTLVRVPPNSPFALTNFVLATSGVRKRIYLIGTAIGMAPRTGVAIGLAAAGAASGARDIQDFVKEGPGLAVFIGGLVALVVVLGIIAHIGNKAIEKVMGPADEDEPPPVDGGEQKEI